MALTWVNASKGPLRQAGVMDTLSLGRRIIAVTGIRLAALTAVPANPR